MGSRRRRQQHHGRRWVVPSVAPAAAALAAAALLLLVVALHCFLSPPQPTPPPFMFNKPGELRRDLVVGAVDFTVPSGGSELADELWVSAAAGSFFGCSNATKEFAGKICVRD